MTENYDEVYLKWLRSLTPITQHNKIDPKKFYCNCGMKFRPGTYHKIIMLLSGTYTWTCPRCGARIIFRLIHHVVKSDTIDNKRRHELWRHG